jgi:hypothetical protein
MIRAAEAARLVRSAIASGSIPAAATLIVSPITITTATTIIRRAVRIGKVPAAFVPRIAVAAAVIVVVALPILTTVAAVIVAILVADELHARLQCLHGLGEPQIAARAGRPPRGRSEQYRHTKRGDD